MRPLLPPPDRIIETKIQQLSMQQVVHPGATPLRVRPPQQNRNTHPLSQQSINHQCLCSTFQHLNRNVCVYSTVPKLRSSARWICPAERNRRPRPATVRYSATRASSSKCCVTRCCTCLSAITSPRCRPTSSPSCGRWSPLGWLR